MKSSSTNNPVGLNDSWSGFDWDQYPGGVNVSVALVYDEALLLVKSTRWNTTMPSFYLQKGQVLAEAWASYAQQLKSTGVHISIAGVAPEISACYSDGRTYHVLIMVSCLKFGPIGALQPVDDSLRLSGYASGCVMACFAAHAMKWSDASRHLPLPEGASLLGESASVAVPAPKPAAMAVVKSRSKTVSVPAAVAGQ